MLWLQLLWDDLRIQHSCLRRDKATLSKCRSWNQRVFAKCASPRKFSLAEAGTFMNDPKHLLPYYSRTLAASVLISFVSIVNISTPVNVNFSAVMSFSMLSRPSLSIEGVPFREGSLCMMAESVNFILDIRCKPFRPFLSILIEFTSRRRCSSQHEMQWVCSTKQSVGSSSGYPSSGSGSWCC